MLQFKTYAQKWEASSKSFEAQGVYSWLAYFLANFPVIYEVGCGTGEESISFLKTGHRIVALEGDKTCLNMTSRAVQNANFHVGTSLDYWKANDLTLIFGDVFDFDNLLERFAPDCIVCFNMGYSYLADQAVSYFEIPEFSSVNEKFMNLSSATIIKICIQLRLAYLASRIGVPLFLGDRFSGSLSLQDSHYSFLAAESGLTATLIDTKEIMIPARQLSYTSSNGSDSPALVSENQKGFETLVVLK